MSETQTQAVTDQPAATANDATSTAGDTYPKEYKFRFNKDSETGFQRLAVELKIPVPTFAGIYKILAAYNQNPSDVAAKKAFELLASAAADQVISEIRGYVADNMNASQENIPWEKFTFQAIANMPQGVRGVSAIAKELWDKFAKAYVATMPTKSNVTAEQAAVRVSVLVQKFRPLTGNAERSKIIDNLMQTVAVFTEALGDAAEEFSPILEFLSKKADELKAENTVVTTDALGF